MINLTDPAPAWCVASCTRSHDAAAGAADLCESEPVVLGPVRLEEAGQDSVIEVSAEVLHDFTRATSTRDVAMRVGMESISMPPSTAVAVGMALIQAAALCTASLSAVSR